MKHKILAYVVRRSQEVGAWQLLVFEHADFPEAGVQVPAGTVEAGEAPEDALWRELFEESGLRPPDLALLSKLAEVPQPQWDVMRHIYLLQAAVGLLPAWRQVVGGAGDDAGLIFEYRWEALSRMPRLAGDLDRWLPLIATTLAQARS